MVGIVVEIKSTYNKNIPSQYNVTVFTEKGTKYIDIRDAALPKKLSKMDVIIFDDNAPISKGNFIHSDINKLNVKRARYGYKR